MIIAGGMIAHAPRRSSWRMRPAPVVDHSSRGGAFVCDPGRPYGSRANDQAAREAAGWRLAASGKHAGQYYRRAA